MQHDDVIWGSLHRHFCSYKVTTDKAKFCRNKYNLTGVCGRISCPLANSRYATIVENDNRLYLFIKTAERAHTPRRLWQRIRLSAQYRRALTQIDEHLEFWPRFYIHKAKQRLTKMTQYLIRKRKLSVQARSRLVGIKKKVDRREQSREQKAERAAKLEASIEKQLLERLKSNAYGDIYNFDQDAYEKVLNEHMSMQQDGGEMQLDEEENENEFEAQYEDDEESDEDDDEEVLEEEDEESDEEDEYADDIEGSANRINSSGQFDFDDEEDSDSGSNDDDQDGQDEDSLPRPRTASELDAYVREKAKRRAKTEKTTSSRAHQKKGRKLRPQRDGVRVEVEYERESERQANKSTR